MIKSLNDYAPKLNKVTKSKKNKKLHSQNFMINQKK